MEAYPKLHAFWRARYARDQRRDRGRELPPVDTLFDDLVAAMPASVARYAADVMRSHAEWCRRDGQAREARRYAYAAEMLVGYAEGREEVEAATRGEVRTLTGLPPEAP